MRRFNSANVESLVARKIIAEDVAPESTVIIDVEDGKLTAK